MKTIKMMKYWIASLSLGLGMQVHAQDAIVKYFEEYMDQEGFTSVYISPRMFGLFKKGDTGKEDFQESVKGIKSLRILTADSAHVVQQETLFQDAKRIMRDKPYEALMDVRKPGEEVQFLILDAKDKPGFIEELLMMVAGEHSFFMLSLTGFFSLEQVSEISETMDLGDQLEYLEETEKH